MRTILISLLLCLVGSVSHAQVQPFNSELPMTCAATKDVLTSIRDEFKERPVWTGFSSSDNSSLALFTNEKTGAWTMIKYNQQFACVLGVGVASKDMLGVPI